MNPGLKRAMQYIRNTNGGATKANFIEDHEPIGDMLWDHAEKLGWVCEDSRGCISLTESGESALDTQP